jgi:hypothetical protein
MVRFPLSSLITLSINLAASLKAGKKIYNLAAIDSTAIRVIYSWGFNGDDYRNNNLLLPPYSLAFSKIKTDTKR